MYLGKTRSLVEAQLDKRLQSMNNQWFHAITTAWMTSHVVII